MTNRLDQNISDFKKDTLEIESFINGTIVSYDFFKSNFPAILKTFDSKERTKSEIAGMYIFEDLNNKIIQYEADIYTFGFINLIARTEAFLNEILETLFIWNKKSLISKKSISYKEVIESKNIDELTDKIRTSEVLEYSHTSFKDKINYLEDKFNLSFPIIDKHLNAIIELFTTRNLLLHNNGIVNETYLRINKKSVYKLGMKRVVNLDYLKQTFVLLIIIAKSIEASAGDKIKGSS